MEYQTYTIRRGDTLSGIAKKYTGSANNYKKIAKENDIRNPNLIYAGATIKIPINKKIKPTGPTQYIKKPEKYKLQKYQFSEQTNFQNFTNASRSVQPINKNTEQPSRQQKNRKKYPVVDSPKARAEVSDNTSVSSYANRRTIKQLEKPGVKTPFVKRSKYFNDGTAVSHDYFGNATAIVNKGNAQEYDLPIGRRVIPSRSILDEIPEDYRVPIDLLLEGNISGLMSYINSAYNRKISNDFVGTQMRPIDMEKAKETEQYRLSEPSVLDFNQATPQSRTGILGKSISYMNMPYDINIKDYKWHYRQRGDMNPVQHTYGMLAPIFNQMTTKDKVKYHSGIIFNPNTGQLSVEPDLNKVPEGWLVNQVNNLGDGSFNVKGMRKDANGNLVMVTPDNREYRKNFTTQYELLNGGYKQPNIFTDMNNADPRTLGAKAGGHFIISAEPKKGNRQARLVHGSLQNLSDAIDRLKQNTNTDHVTVYPLDGGSFSMGYVPQKAVGQNGMQWITIDPSELNIYQNQNSSGSSGFMPIDMFPQIPDTTYIIR